MTSDNVGNILLGLCNFSPRKVSEAADFAEAEVGLDQKRQVLPSQHQTFQF